MHKTMAPPSNYRWGRGNWGQDLNLRPSGYEGGSTQPADGRRHSCFQSFRGVAGSADSTGVRAGLREFPRVRTRSGQSFGEPVRTGDLRLGNERGRRSRIPPTLPESASFDFIRVFRRRPRVGFHDSSRGFFSFMCPACATPPVGESPGVARRNPGFRVARLLDCTRLRPLRALRVATLPRLAERNSGSTAGRLATRLGSGHQGR